MSMFKRFPSTSDLVDALEQLTPGMKVDIVLAGGKEFTILPKADYDLIAEAVNKILKEANTTD